MAQSGKRGIEQAVYVPMSVYRVEEWESQSLCASKSWGFHERNAVQVWASSRQPTEVFCTASKELLHDLSRSPEDGSELVAEDTVYELGSPPRGRLA